MFNLTHDELIFLINQKYPDMVHGKDFWVAQDIDPETYKQSSEPFIVKWSGPHKQPNQIAIEVMRKAYRQELAVFKKRGKVPQLIAKTACYEELVAQNVITQQEALAALTSSSLPKKLFAYVQSLPSDSQFSALIELQGSSEFKRKKSIIVGFFKYLEWTSDKIDQFFVDAYKRTLETQ